MEIIHWKNSRSSSFFPKKFKTHIVSKMSIFKSGNCTKKLMPHSNRHVEELNDLYFKDSIDWSGTIEKFTLQKMLSCQKINRVTSPQAAILFHKVSYFNQFQNGMLHKKWKLSCKTTHGFWSSVDKSCKKKQKRHHKRSDFTSLCM